MMQALVYQGPGKKSFVEHAKPTLEKATDAIVKITKTTICGTDLHEVLKAYDTFSQAAATKALEVILEA